MGVWPDVCEHKPVGLRKLGLWPDRVKGGLTWKKTGKIRVDAGQSSSIMWRGVRPCGTRCVMHDVNLKGGLGMCLAHDYLEPKSSLTIQSTGLNPRKVRHSPKSSVLSVS